MDFAPSYLIQRFFYRIFDFFHHWYVDGSQFFRRRCIGVLAAVDRIFAITITLRHFLKPLYPDHVVIGRILGVIFRTGKILVGAVVYLFVALLFLVSYLIWILIPVATLFYATYR